MSQAGYTPIQLYYSTTAAAVPVNTNLANGELAINITDGKLYYKDNGGTVRLLASNATSAPVLSFQTSLSGLTPSTATTGVVTLAGTLGVASGGTGLTTLATGSLTYGAGTSAFSALAIGTAGQILTVNSGATAPQWSTLSGVAVTTFSAGTTGLTPSSATSGAVTLAGTLATTNGGTGLTSFTANGVVYASSTSALATGSALTFDGTKFEVSRGTTANASATGATTRTNSAFAIAAAVDTNTRAMFGIDTNTNGWVQVQNTSSNGVADFIINPVGGNLGLGVTPNAWTTSFGFKAFDIGQGCVLGATSDVNLIYNAFFNSSNNWVYKTTAEASRYQQSGAIHAWYNAASGTAGNTITFAERMRLDASGNLGIGTSSPSTFGKVAIQVTGSTTPTTGANVGPASVNLYVGANGGANSTTGIFGWFDGTPGIGSGVGFSRNSDGDWGTQIRFYTHPTATSNIGNITERLRIAPAGTLTLYNDYQEQTFTANSSTAITLDIVTNGTDQVITLTGTATITMPTATAGKSFLLKLKTGAGGYTVTWTTVKWPSGTAPTLTSTASRMDIFSFFSDGTNWYGCTVGQNYTP